MIENFNTRVEIELLKKDVNIMASLCEKFDKTIDKMQEIASSLSKMVSLQEQRLETQESATKEVQSILEMRRIEHNNDIKDLHSRITTVNRELSDKIEETEKTILAELHEMRKELKTDKMFFGDRIGKIEVWKYTVVGALMVITWIAAKVDIIKILFTH
jgi:hypothetical protein